MRPHADDSKGFALTPPGDGVRSTTAGGPRDRPARSRRRRRRRRRRLGWRGRGSRCWPCCGCSTLCRRRRSRRSFWTRTLECRPPAAHLPINVTLRPLLAPAAAHRQAVRRYRPFNVLPPSFPAFRRPSTISPCPSPSFHHLSLPFAVLPLSFTAFHRSSAAT